MGLFICYFNTSIHTFLTTISHNSIKKEMSGLVAALTHLPKFQVLKD